MNTAPSTNDLRGEPASEETAELRAKVDKLSGDRIHPAVVAAADQAQQAVDWVDEETKRLVATIRERPLTSIGIAALAGFVLAKVTRR